MHVRSLVGLGQPRLNPFTGEWSGRRLYPSWPRVPSARRAESGSSAAWTRTMGDSDRGVCLSGQPHVERLAWPGWRAGSPPGPAARSEPGPAATPAATRTHDPSSSCADGPGPGARSLESSIHHRRRRGIGLLGVDPGRSVCFPIPLARLWYLQRALPLARSWYLQRALPLARSWYLQRALAEIGGGTFGVPAAWRYKASRRQ
jgi:hypothetical protein